MGEIQNTCQKTISLRLGDAPGWRDYRRTGSERKPRDFERFVRLPRTLSVVAALSAVFLLTLLLRAITAVNATTVGFAYLITILVIAASWGIVESVLASILAALCFSYFFLPPFGFAIAALEDWVALV